VKLIVGLGNPGVEYFRTRHNAGSLVVEALIGRHGGLPLGIRCHSELYAGRIEGELVLLAKPLTFMNRSGEAVGPLLEKYRLGPGSLMVIHDDIDLSPGRIKEKYSGGDAGHRGVASIIAVLGTDRFCRIRVGVGRPPQGMEAADYVLEPLQREAWEELGAAVEAATERVEAVLKRKTSW
jgi:PTH1 family peptidyl-tRNA hydrolase